MDIFASESEIEKAPVVDTIGKRRSEEGIIKKITPQRIYLKAQAKNGLFLSFKVREIRFLNRKNTAILEPSGFRKYPWSISRKYREDIMLDDVVIPEKYKEDVERLLDISEHPPQVSDNEQHLPFSEYRLPILEALAEMGGKGKAKNVLDRVYEKIKDRVTDDDRKILQSGQYFWENRAHWVRLQLKEQGYLRADTPKGIWELTDEGWKYLKELKRLAQEK
ncbi:winged helix-turn-helix domain-containing protein [bacterium]|nr:winged helix-turn-helix domain-containing protein [bacterium]